MRCSSCTWRFLCARSSGPAAGRNDAWTSGRPGLTPPPVAACRFERPCGRRYPGICDESVRPHSPMHARPPRQTQRNPGRLKTELRNIGCSGNSFRRSTESYSSYCPKLDQKPQKALARSRRSSSSAGKSWSWMCSTTPGGSSGRRCWSQITSATHPPTATQLSGASQAVRTSPAIK